MLKIEKTIGTLNFRLVAKAPALFVYDNERMRTVFYKDDLIQVDSFTGILPKAVIESAVLPNIILKKTT
jgi:hypothetical protein